MNRQEAIALAQKIKDIRRRKAEDKVNNRQMDFAALLRLMDMPWFERECAMERLVQDGYAKSVDEVWQMLKDKRLYLDGGSGSPTESTGMSDDQMDAGIQYIGVNQDLL